MHINQYMYLSCDNFVVFIFAGKSSYIKIRTIMTSVAAAPPPPPPPDTPEWEKARKALEKIQKLESVDHSKENQQHQESLNACNIPYPGALLDGGGRPPMFGAAYPSFSGYGPSESFPPFCPGPNFDGPDGFGGRPRFGRPLNNFRGVKRGGLLPTPPGSGIRFQLPKKNVAPNNNFMSFGHGPRRPWPNARHPPPLANGGFGQAPPRTPFWAAHDDKVKPEGSENAPKTDDQEETKMEIYHDVVSSSAASSSNSQQTPAATSIASKPKTGAGGAAVQDEWPPNLKAFVGRCFNECKTNEDKDAMEKYLRDKLTSSFNNGLVYKIDWDNEPLPIMPSGLKAKANAALAFASRTLSPLQQSPSSVRGAAFGRGATRGAAFGSRRGVGGGLASAFGNRRWSPAGFSSRDSRRSRSRSKSRSRSPYSRSHRHSGRSSRRHRR